MASNINEKTYFVVTALKNWGKGRSLIEAAKNAHVGRQPVQANVFHAPDNVVETASIGIFGQLGFTTKDGIPKDHLGDALWVGAWKMRLTGTGKLTLEDIPGE